MAGPRNLTQRRQIIRPTGGNACRRRGGFVIPDRGLEIDVQSSTDIHQPKPCVLGPRQSEGAGRIGQKVKTIDLFSGAPLDNQATLGRIEIIRCNASDAAAEKFGIPIQKFDWFRLRHEIQFLPTTVRTAYAGRSITRKCIRARYSPKMPIAKSCAPEKMAIAEARNAKPGTTPPSLR